MALIGPTEQTGRRFGAEFERQGVMAFRHRKINGTLRIMHVSFRYTRVQCMYKFLSPAIWGRVGWSRASDRDDVGRNLVFRQGQQCVHGQSRSRMSTSRPYLFLPQFTVHPYTTPALVNFGHFVDGDLVDCSDLEPSGRPLLVWSMLKDVNEDVVLVHFGIFVSSQTPIKYLGQRWPVPRSPRS